MDFTYRPYIDPEMEVLMEKIHPPRVCIDNDSYPNCTLVKVDSANKHGMLLEMVQVLTDLDLLISKSYISSDGGWLMDVFHVTDQLGNKLIDQSLIHHIQEGICASRLASRDVIKPGIHREVGPTHVLTGHMALEMTGIDRPGLMSEMAAVLDELGCHLCAAAVWTHHDRAACIMYMKDSTKDGLLMDPSRAAQVQAQLKNVVEAHHRKNEKRSVTLAAPVPGQTHTERRLHQLMAEDRDYEECCSCCASSSEWDDGLYALGGGVQSKGCNGTHVKIEKCKENCYSIITIRSRDRPKLLFDTVCALTDLQYVVHHASISSNDSIALQEYYVRHTKGGIVNSDVENRRVTKCLIAAIERRVSDGLRLDICTRNRTRLLSDITRVFRENGLSVTRAEMGVRGEDAVGTFYLKGTSGGTVSPETVEMIRQEIGGNITVLDNTTVAEKYRRTSNCERGRGEDDRSRFSLGNLLRLHLERLSSNFRLVKY